MPFSQHSFIPNKIIQIGAGGVGSRIVPEITFFIRGNFDVLRNTEYIIVDHDRVSASNLNRQSFFYHEVSDQTKGQIMVNRYRDMVNISQIPEPVNSDTLPRIFDNKILGEKLLVILSADNGLVVKQVLEHLIQNARSDWYFVFTGANLVEREVGGTSIQTGEGQAYSYGVVNGTPLFLQTPYEIIPDIMATQGYGPTSTGQNCGVDQQSGAQTPLMNQSCALYVMMLIQSFFEKGLFCPAIYFTNSMSVNFGDWRAVEDILQPVNLEEEAAEETVENEENLVINEA